ncbi:hypothetical protein V6U90_25450 [Micromonospora sp. CPCC 206060]|uniref:hypothetical protein n=1 Tax=Micromonospora sp. CPCC 206060 TaxID=3122406 RepID=UPI002FF19390
MILAVGPRELPTSGTVQVWVDSGTGSGQQIEVPVRDLQVAECDQGEGRSALYKLRTTYGRG